MVVEKGQEAPTDLDKRRGEKGDVDDVPFARVRYLYREAKEAASWLAHREFVPEVDHKSRSSVGTVMVSGMAFTAFGGCYNTVRGMFAVRPLLPYLIHGVGTYALFSFPILTLREVFYYKTIQKRNRLSPEYDSWKTIDQDELIASAGAGAVTGSVLVARDALMNGMRFPTAILRAFHGGFIFALGVSALQVGYSTLRNYRMDSAIRWHLRSMGLPDTVERKKMVDAGIPFDLIMKGSGTTSSALSENGGIGITFPTLSRRESEFDDTFSMDTPELRKALLEKGLSSQDGDFLADIERWFVKQFRAILGKERADSYLFVNAMNPDYRKERRDMLKEVEKNIKAIENDIEFLYAELDLEERLKMEKEASLMVDTEEEKEYESAVKIAK